MTLTRRQLLSLAALYPLHPGRGSGAPAKPLFLEQPPAKTGLRWVHTNAASEDRYLPEALGPGCAFLDYDNDGWLDIYLVNSGPCDFWKPKTPIRNALYKNNRDGTFIDVTESAGVSGGSFGMGVAIGDYDNDGWPDLFVTAYGNCILYKNNRNGTFSDITAKAGLSILGWTTSAVWFDYDNDGRLDLFVCSFVDYSTAHQFDCGVNQLGKRYYCTPRRFKGTPSFLFHNNGDGTFTDVTRQTDIAKAIGKGLGVVATDINNDGRMDLFVANDTVQNFLYVNRGPGRNHAGQWEEIALPAEVAYSSNGQPRSGMGVDSADLNQDGYEDLFVANVDQEMFSLYRNNKDETFTDIAYAEGVAQATRTLSGWGLKYFDYDNDGAVDLFLANGHPDDMIGQYSTQVKYREPLLLFHQELNGKLRDVSAQAGPAFHTPMAARGLAVGDYDNDGALDVLVCNNGGAPALLKNNAAVGNNWIGLILEGVTCNRDAIGAKLYWTAGGKRRSRLKTNGGSYLSSHDPREVLGLGPAPRVELLEIHWPPPSRRIDRLTSVPVNRYIRVVEGKGIVS
jgi:hypothetical protein